MSIFSALFVPHVPSSGPLTAEAVLPNPPTVAWFGHSVFAVAIDDAAKPPTKASAIIKANLREGRDSGRL
jgi:hypothetical protein